MSVPKRVRNLFLAGVTVVVPVAISVRVLFALVKTVSGILAPVTGAIRQSGGTSETSLLVLQVLSPIGVVLLILATGAVVRRWFGRRFVDRVDTYLTQLPGVGAVYRTARRMSNPLVGAGDAAPSEFRDVKLVEFPAAGTFTLGFLTAGSPPEEVTSAVRTVGGGATDEYRTLFLPMAPNPMTGGYLTHVPAERVHDVDVGMEAALQYILTTGSAEPPLDSSSER